MESIIKDSSTGKCESLCVFFSFFVMKDRMSPEVDVSISQK